jgi:hypothetical protein
LNKKTACSSLEGTLPGKEQRDLNNPQDLLSCIVGTASKRLSKGFHLSKFLLTILEARCHDALHSCQLQFHSRRWVTKALHGVAEKGFLVTEQPEIRPIRPYLYFGDLCHVFQMTNVITPL